jgi:ribosomal protein S6--L-glutamate ligase
LTEPPAIIRDNESFFQNFHLLSANSLVCCRLRLSPGEEHLLVDLLTRGVKLIPSASAQLASRSKVHQARIFADYMLPQTVAVYNTSTLLEITSLYRQQGIGRVVLKQDRKNGGLGIHLFEDIENVYNQAAFGKAGFPFVLQPFIERCRDIRVIWLGDYIEAYERINRNNFRHNLHCGGTASPHELSPALMDLCYDIMQRGGFPYAHIDLMLTEDGKVYLTEINLRGGLKGARIDTHTYRKKLSQIHDMLAAEMQAAL